MTVLKTTEFYPKHTCKGMIVGMHKKRVHDDLVIT